MALDRLTAADVFVRIARHGSLSAAADALGMSRAMVSRYLAQMESWAGTRLLHRTTRRIGLTDAGTQALERCRQMLEIAAAVPAAATPADEPQGTLRISCSQALAQQVLAPAIAVWLLRHPLAAVDLQVDNRLAHLVEDRIDLAVRITAEPDPNLVARPLARCASVLCAAPAYLAAHGTPRCVEDLALHHCLTYAHFGRSLWQFTAAGDPAAPPASVAVGGRLSATESLALQAAAAQGAGIALLPRFTAGPLLADGRLVALLPPWRPRELGVYGVYATRRQMTPALRSMLDFLAAHFADPACWPG